MTRKDTFKKRYKELGGDCPPVIIPSVIRINTLATTAKKLVTRLAKKGVKLEKINGLRNGYTIIKSPFSLGATEESLLGQYYLHNEAAQYPVSVLGVEEGETILDSCASPGGKTSQLAARMKNTGIIVSIEKKKERLARLSTNLSRMNVKNTVVYWMDARNSTTLGQQFDRVLLDAPCSGNYTQEKKWFNKRTLADIKTMGKLQYQLLVSAYSVLKPGGTLVYSTCSLEPEENELVINKFLKSYNAQLEETGIRIGEPGLTKVFKQKLAKDLRKTRRFWPQQTGTEGFYIAKLRKP